MANTKISNLTALAATPAVGDLFALVDVSASETKKLAASYVARSDGASKVLSGNGRELTLPSTSGGTAAVLGANTFTGPQTIDNTAGAGVGLSVQGLAGQDIFRALTAGGERSIIINQNGDLIADDSSLRLQKISRAVPTTQTTETLTIDITGNTANRATILRIALVLGNTSLANRRSFLIADVSIHLQGTGANSTLINNTEHVNVVSGALAITGPTTIADGIRYSITTDWRIDSNVSTISVEAFSDASISISLTAA